MGWLIRALFSCAALIAAVALAPAALASGLVPDPDPNASENDPQPDAYQSVPATYQSVPATAPESVPATAPSSPASKPTPTLLPTVPVSHPTTVPVSHPTTADRSAPSRVRPSVVATPVQAAVAAREAPAVRSTPSRTEAQIAIPTAVHAVSVTHKQRSHAVRSATHRQRHVVVHRTRAARTHAATQKTPISFARTALELRWPAAFAPSAVMEAARPRHVTPGVALAVAAVVLLSGAFIAVAARQVREQL
jgi:hypothetical protein